MTGSSARYTTAIADAMPLRCGDGPRHRRIRREDWLHSGGFWGRSGHEADVDQSLLLTLVV